MDYTEAMPPAATYVRARIDAATKRRAATALQDLGLSVSDAIRLLLMRIAEEHRLPFEVKVLNGGTRAAIAELEAGKGKKFQSVDALMADLHADDSTIFHVEAGLQTRSKGPSPQHARKQLVSRATAASRRRTT